ncbi:MAG: DUF2220 family protein [Collinsella stercoris]|nr:DUF2220 family protein [Collinsella stercoris]
MVGYGVRERFELENTAFNWLTDEAGVPEKRAHGIAHCLADRAQPVIKRKALTHLLNSHVGAEKASQLLHQMQASGLIALEKGSSHQASPHDVFNIHPATRRTSRPSNADEPAPAHKTATAATPAVPATPATTGGMDTSPTPTTASAQEVFRPSSSLLSSKMPALAQDPNQLQRNLDKLRLLDQWLEQTKCQPPLPASLNQRAYEIFNNEKALDPHLDGSFCRLLRRLDVGDDALRLTVFAEPDLATFIPYGSKGPILVVENGDTFATMRHVLGARPNAKVLGQQLGGVIYGAGGTVCTPGLLDRTLDYIGYTGEHVLYWGDIDRSGVALISRLREVSAVDIRLARPFYRKMVQLQKARERRGFEVEGACKQVLPEQLDEIAREIPLFARWAFLQTIREGKRIPQEIVQLKDLLGA